MTQTQDLWRSYLRSKIGLGEPELFLTRGDRSAVLAAAARVGTEPPEVPATAGAQGMSAAAPVTVRSAADELDELRVRALVCERCRLHESRLSVVFGEGTTAARVLCVGEAPGANEDRTGRPFVGRAGKLLDQLLLSVGMPRESVFICNVLKCRPPGNRNPQPDEIATCSPYLREQIRLVSPEVIVAFGTFASRTLLGSGESLGRLRGMVHLLDGIPLVPTYHPAALLRNPGWIRPTWEDLQTARGVLESADVDGDTHG
ncbi:MAG: uracil-DNA glycosylase [Gemmatimonadota bacterium]